SRLYAIENVVIDCGTLMENFPEKESGNEKHFDENFSEINSTIP
ncbi:hypothetical protein TNIN_142951, partial [Trichonephila inaurata madagascariensis]